MRPSRLIAALLATVGLVVALPGTAEAGRRLATVTGEVVSCSPGGIPTSEWTITSQAVEPLSIDDIQPADLVLTGPTVDPIPPGGTSVFTSLGSLVTVTVSDSELTDALEATAGGRECEPICEPYPTCTFPSSTTTTESTTTTVATGASGVTPAFTG